MKKQLATLLLTFIFCFTTVIPGFAADSAVPMADKIGAMEKMLYGTEQSGSLLQRMDSLEDDVYGTITSDAILNRVDNMYDYLEGTPDNGEASFATKLNVVEWKMNESMSGGAAKNRIEATEKLLYGQNQTGSLSGRLESLLKLASYTDGNVPVQQVVLPKDSVFKIAFTSELSTKMSRKGDVVHFKAADNLYVNDVLVLPKGATGVGEVKKVVQPGIFGKDGRIDIDFTCIYGVDGTKIPVTVGELAKQKAESIAGAAGAAIGGMIILGPVGLVGGAFVKGNSVTIPVGCETFVQTAEDTSLQDGAVETDGVVVGDEQRQAGFVVADVGVHRRAVALGNVGRIRYDRVEPLRKSLLQPVQGIGFAERDRCAELLEILRRHG